MTAPRASFDRLARVALATAFLLSALAARDLARPAVTVACSCMPQQPLAAYAKEPRTIIVAGTIGPVADQEAVLAIERLYLGNLADPNLRVRGGDSAMCGVTLVAGTRVLMVAFMEAGVANASSCSPFADLATAEGRRLLDEAQAFFGGEAPPATGPPTNPPAAPIDGDVDPGLALGIILGLVIAMVVVLFGVVAIVARRRPVPPR